MNDWDRPVNSPEAMIAVVRRYGILPLFRSSIPGWSVEDMTAPGCWFDTEGVLGPWDWKVDVVQQGDIAYGRFIEGKAAFATVDWYRHLMNWRRSLPQYRMAIGGKYKAASKSERMNKAFAPAVLDAVKAEGEIRAEGLRAVCSAAVSPSLLKSLGPKYEPLLVPSVKKNIYDGVARYLQMGTWLVVGDIERVYRGPNLTYSGWQKSSLTTPDELFGNRKAESNAPAWARRFESETGAEDDGVKCTPEESRRILQEHILELAPNAGLDKLNKLI